MKIAFITTTRAEYGLLYPLIKKILNDDYFDVNVIVSGTHLLKKYGYTVGEIENDEIPIAYKLKIMDENYESTEIQAIEVASKSVSVSANVFTKEKYDGIVVLGDRYELLGFCTAAILCRIPIIHIHGGEITEGAIDDKIRHAITKLASVHFPSIKQYADRIVQMGEQPDMVYAVGALGIDNIKNTKYINKNRLFEILGVPEHRKVAVVTYHPVTVCNPDSALLEVTEVMEALIRSGIYSVVTMPNSDAGGDLIYNKLLEYENIYNDNITLKKSLGKEKYLSLLKYADIMVGNSSSGIIESASFKLPTVDIGLRQKGRISSENVIHCECKRDDIYESIEYALSTEFKQKIKNCVNIYGDGNTANRILNVLKNIKFTDRNIIQKIFYDIKKI